MPLVDEPPPLTGGDQLRTLLAGARVIAVVGLSDNPQRDSRHVAWDCEHRCPAMRARVML